MATAATAKKTCPYGSKCYRKNKKHHEEFTHPGDKNVLTGKKPRLVHAISENNDEPPTLKKRASKRKSDESADEIAPKTTAKATPTSLTPSPSTPTPSPSKKVKLADDEEEKIAVDYSKTKKKTSSPESNGPAGSDATSKPDDESSTSGESRAVPEVIQYKEKKAKCKYWDTCYQTSEAHKKEFDHPSDHVDEDDDDHKKKKKTGGDAATPSNPLEDGGTVAFDSGYKLKREGDIYTCTCKGFLAQRAPINERTCKHLKEYLGEDFEKLRQQKNAVPKKAHIKSHIAVNLLLAHKYEEKTQNPVGWWISEKLDGVRAFWNGRCFYSRLGNAFYAPEWFTKDLPRDIHLDGELFGGRGEFQSTVSIVKTAESPKWKDIKYYVFDSPHMGKEVFEKRMQVIKEYFEAHQPEYAVFVEQTKCKSKDHLEEKLTRILNIGGEGLMIRQPGSVYEACRSKTLLKIKKFYDAEAIVIGHEKGKGANQFRCGALRCRMACGKEFSVGSGLTNKDRNNPPKIGSIITYKFQELSKGGSPRFPTYVGICIDKTEPKDADIREVMDEDEA